MTYPHAHGGAASLPTPEAARIFLSAGLDPTDREALLGVCGDVRTVGAGTDLMLQGSRSEALHILLDGWAARYTFMTDGSRSIPALSVPGDICDLDALRFDRLDYGVTMLSAGSVVALPRNRLKTLLATNPAIAEAFWACTLAENTILTAWATSVGRRSAQERLAHLLCELLMRLTAVGQADGYGYDLPLTQEHLADALGLTSVHVNRTLQALRSKDLVTVQHRHVTIHDWDALCKLCGFDGNYLHLETIDATFTRNLPSVTSAGGQGLTRFLPPSSDVPFLSSAAAR
jgi:CRP-like cAMP-binding protein